MLKLSQVSLRAGGFSVEDVNLSVRAEQYFVLMGPTGSGKSLLVKSICGFRPVSAGRILIDDIDVTNLQPRQRGIGYVPQSSALFVHLSVERNLTFAPQGQGLSRNAALTEIEKIVDSLGLVSLLGRSVGGLSGGEQQKVALGRALARKPKLLILDEPVSAVDEPSRAEICQMLRKVQKEFGITTVHVCHSVEEAKLVSDVVGIMSQGRIVQVDTLENLKQNPANPQVARVLLL